MAKRKRSKAKRSSRTNIGGLSSRQYNKLKREARNARRRLTDFSKRSDASNYYAIDASNYTLAALIERIEAGESVKNILGELSSLTPKNLTSGVPLDLMETSYGYKMLYVDRQNLKAEVERANRVIEEARKRMPDLEGVLPQKFNYNEIQSKMVNEEALSNTLAGLQQYIPDNMQLIGLPGTGEAITKAEYLASKAIIDRENLRRKEKEEQVRQAIENVSEKGYFRQQNRYDTRPIELEKLDREALRRRASTWDDPARVYRANLFLQNYSKQLDTMKMAYLTQGLWNETIEERFDYVSGVINRLYNNEQAITFISENMPDIDISIISGQIVGSAIFSQIYNAWTQVEDEFL